MGRESKAERCVEWERRVKQRGMLSGKAEKTERFGECKGRTKQRDGLGGKGEQYREIF